MADRNDLAPSRRYARWEVQYAYTRNADQFSLLDEGSWQHPAMVDVESQDERGSEEYDVLGFTLSVDHPLDLVRDELQNVRPICAEELRRHVGQEVDVAGVVVAGRRIHVADDRLMAFASLCDVSGTMELTLFSEAAEQYGDILAEGGMIVARGLVTANDERGVGVEVHALRTIPAYH